MITLESARQYYPGSDAVHGFDHIERVYAMCQRIGTAEGADMEIVLTAALLHDMEGSHPEANRADHHFDSALEAERVLRGEGWSQPRIGEVTHCIRAHRYRDDREPPHTLEAKVVFDSDKLDVLGAVGVARTIAYAAQAGQPVYFPPSELFLERGDHEPGEPHSAYHEYLFKLRKVKDRLFTNTARQIAAERSVYLRDYFDRLIAESKGEC